MDKYCDRCGEMNLLSFIDCNLRPFDIYCSESCIDSHWDDIENKKWDEYDDYDKGLKDFYSKEIEEGDINPKFWRKWFVDNSKFFMWDEKKSKYKLVNEKGYISHYQLREEANEG